MASANFEDSDQNAHQKQVQQAVPVRLLTVHSLKTATELS